MQKVRGGPLLSFSGCRIFFNPLLFKVLFIVSLAVLFTITDTGYSFVRRWSSSLQPEKLILRHNRCSCLHPGPSTRVFTWGYHGFQRVGTAGCAHPKVRSPLLFGSRLICVPNVTKMFQFTLFFVCFMTGGYPPKWWEPTQNELGTPLTNK